MHVLEECGVGTHQGLYTPKSPEAGVCGVSNLWRQGEGETDAFPTRYGLSPNRTGTLCRFGANPLTRRRCEPRATKPYPSHFKLHFVHGI